MIMNAAQREARKRDRAAIEKARRPAIAHLIRRARLWPTAIKQLVAMGQDETNSPRLRAEIWKDLAKLAADAQTELLDRTGVQKLKSVELRAFDDLARELENENRPAPQEVTPDQIRDAVRAIILMGAGRVKSIEVPYEEKPTNGSGTNGPH